MIEGLLTFLRLLMMDDNFMKQQLLDGTILKTKGTIIYFISILLQIKTRIFQ